MRVSTQTLLRIGLITSLLGLGGCFNGESESSLDLGSVSIGEQLIDLQKAHEVGAINDEEYRTAKQTLLGLLTRSTNNASGTGPATNATDATDTNDSSQQDSDEDDEDEDDDFIF